MGCWAAALAVKEGLPAEKLVFISPPSDLRIFSDLFAQQAGFTQRVMKKVEDRLEKRTGVSWSELKAESLAEGQDTPLMIIHDRDDRVVHLDHAEAMHDSWEGSRLYITSGLGHRLTVKTPEVIENAVEFITG
jgi:pimeloyl-ACP methyl ester carboxylesterase